MKRYIVAMIRGMLLVLVVGLAGCMDTSVANTASRNVDGLTFAISGPALSEPQVFVIPADNPKMGASISGSRIFLQLRHGGEIFSENGKHRLNGLMLGTNKGATGEFSEREGVDKAWFTFGFNFGTDAAEGATMDFDYSKGERQPVSIVIETFEERSRVSGHFTARVQRTNHSSSDQFYDLKGSFSFRRD